jgi:hypothetical protein
MTPEQYLLASAYLDGELTAEERRLAEADPAVMAEVEALRALRVELADVEPATAEARESAIAAAMAVFSAGAGVDAAASLPTAVPSRVVPFKPRPAYGRYLGIAAAVIGVGLLGTVIINSGRGSDDTSSDAAELPSIERNMVEDAPAVTDAAADEPADEPADLAAEMVTAGDAADDMADMAVTTDAPASAPAEADVPAATTPADPSLPADDVLIIAAEDIIARREAGTLGATPDTRCTVPDAPNAFVLDEVELGTELGSVDLFLAIDDTTRTVYGIDPESCVVLVDAPLP